MLVSILRQRDYLIASIHEALDDSEIVRLQEELVEQIGRYRARGIIIDVAALDVTETVIVGIQPTVAFAMVRLGMGLDNVRTALDLEEGLEHLERLLKHDLEHQTKR